MWEKPPTPVPPTSGVGDCDRCHGLGTAIRSPMQTQDRVTPNASGQLFRRATRVVGRCGTRFDHGSSKAKSQTGDTKPIVSTGRFHVFSSEDEHRHVISSDDEPLIPSNGVDPHESVRSHQVGCCRRGWTNFRFTAVVRQIGRGCIL